MGEAVSRGMLSKKAVGLGALLVWCLLLWLPVQGQQEKPAPGKKSAGTKPPGAESSLFRDDQVLQFTLVADYQQLLRDRGEERAYHPATLAYTDSTGREVELQLKVMVRGNRRRDPAVCRFPPIMLNFARKTTPAGTLFSQVDKVKLVTHCVNEDLVLREYLVYKVYNVLTDQSFRVRLCRVTYVDVEQDRKTEQRLAFLIEDDKVMAARNKAKLLSRKTFVRMERADQQAMARLALFQYMIGNTDWSVPFRHNIELLSTDTLAPPIPVPFDFDYAGIVSAPYATPPPELRITSVRQRLYRGYTFPESIHREVLNTFNAYRTPIYAVYRQCELLERGSLKQTLKYLDSFYKIINNPRQYRNEVVRAGERNVKSYVAVSGLQ